MSTHLYPLTTLDRPKLLKVPEVAEMLGVKPRHLRNGGSGAHSLSETAWLKHSAFRS
jgi:hypothetical protein